MLSNNINLHGQIKPKLYISRKRRMKGKYLILGTNLGNKMKNLETAISLIRQQVGHISAMSSIYESEAWGYTSQPSFLNQVIQIETELNPQELLDGILSIELQMGRVRFDKWHERLIDIDILFYDDEIIRQENLVVPHIEIPNRKFTLVPLCELAANEIHPGLQKSLSDLLKDNSDPLRVSRYV